MREKGIEIGGKGLKDLLRSVGQSGMYQRRTRSNGSIEMMQIQKQDAHTSQRERGKERPRDVTPKRFGKKAKRGGEEGRRGDFKAIGKHRGQEVVLLFKGESLSRLEEEK